MTAARFDNTDGRLRGEKGKQRRVRIWAIDPDCARCGKLTVFPDGFHIDHKIPLHKGGADADENLQVLCIPCHEAKTDEDLGRLQRQKFDSQGRVVW